MKSITCAERIQRLEKAIDEAIASCACRDARVVEALQALRGVARSLPLALSPKLGSLSRFQQPTATDGL